MEIKEIKVPKNLYSLPIGMFQELSKVLDAYKDNPDDDDMVFELISVFTKQPLEVVMRGNLEDLLNIGMHLLTLMGSHEQKDLPKELDVDGKQYILTGGSVKWSGGQYKDIKTHLGLFEVDYSLIVACMYIPKGTKYDDTPMTERAKVFKDHFPTSVYLDTYPFFLKSWNKLIKGSSQEKNPKPKRKLFGRKQKKLRRG